jgi:predicted ATPase
VIAGYEHGVWLIDLAPLVDQRLVPSAVATVLGLEIRTVDPLPGLVAGLRDKRMLQLLDNCEHVIDAAASLAAAALIKRGPACRSDSGARSVGRGQRPPLPRRRRG